MTNYLRVASKLVGVAVMTWIVGTGLAQAQTAINQSSALAGGVTSGDGPGFPVTINAPGRYVLTSNLTVGPNVSGVRINADGVTLDLNGFTIIGPGPGSGHGVTSTGCCLNITVRNGYITGFGSGSGIMLAGPGHRVESIRAFGNGASGISIGDSCTVTDSTANGNGVAGVFAGNACLIRTTSAIGNRSYGIAAGDGSSVYSSVASGNGSFGIKFFESAAKGSYGQNTLTGNNGLGAQVDGGLSVGQNICRTSGC